jgi:hypothetical protein
MLLMAVMVVVVAGNYQLLAQMVVAVLPLVQPLQQTLYLVKVASVQD